MQSTIEWYTHIENVRNIVSQTDEVCRLHKDQTCPGESDTPGIYWMLERQRGVVNTMHKKIVHLQIRFVTDKYEINIICTKDRKLRRATVVQLLKNHNTYNVEVITWSWKSKSESWEECMESFKEIEYMKLNNIYTRDLENLADDNTPLPFSLNTELHSLIYFFCFLLYFFSISTKVNKNKITLSSFWLYSPRPEIKDNLIPTFYSPYQYPKISISFFISDTIFHHNCIRKK